MYNPFSLEDKTVLVTGASSGIGQQCAIDCSRMGAKVTLIARTETRLQETLSLLDHPERHCYYMFDLFQTGQIKPLVDEIVEKQGKIDGFVYAAGIEKTLPVKLLTPDDYMNVFKVNTLGAFEFIRYFSNKRIFQGWWTYCVDIIYYFNYRARRSIGLCCF